jgi:hypothetical protein
VDDYRILDNRVTITVPASPNGNRDPICQVIPSSYKGSQLIVTSQVSSAESSFESFSSNSNASVIVPARPAAPMSPAMGRLPGWATRGGANEIAECKRCILNEANAPHTCMTENEKTETSKMRNDTDNTSLKTMGNENVIARTVHQPMLPSDDTASGASTPSKRRTTDPEPRRTPLYGQPNWWADLNPVKDNHQAERPQSLNLLPGATSAASNGSKMNSLNSSGDSQVQSYLLNVNRS